jgi:hypothetical protein
MRGALWLLLAVCAAAVSVVSTDAAEKRASATVVAREVLSGNLEPALTTAQLREWSVDSLHGSVKPLFDAVERKLTQDVFVRVVLIGFAGDVMALEATDKEMLALLGEAAATSAAPVHTLRGERLPVTTSVHYSVSMAHKTVTTRLRDEIAKALEGSTTPQLLPVERMQGILSQAFSDLHLATPVIFIVNAGRHNVGYSWSVPQQQCATVQYASANQRFAWLDVNAGPLEWGPISAGEGGAMRHVLPFIYDATMFPRHKERFLASVAGWISRTVTTLLTPSLSRAPFLGASRHVEDLKGAFEVRFVFADEYSPENPTKRAAVMGQHRTDVCGALASFAPTFMKVNYSCVEPLYLEVDKNVFVAAAIAGARRHVTSHLSTSTHAYLDSKALRHWLKRHLPHIDYELLSTHSLPIVLLHTRDFILLDRTHQAVAFDDMIIAVVSSEHSGMMVTYDYYCNSHSEQRVRIDSGNATRAIVSALLDALWGVAPLHVHYEPEHERAATDFTWSIAGTPAGMFSNAVNASSFFIKDAISRNIVVQAAQVHFTYLQNMIVKRLEPDLALLKILSTAEYVEVGRHWNLWQFKRGEFESELSLLAHGNALLYLQSMQKDLVAIAHRLSDGLGRTTMERDCLVGTGSAWGWTDVGAVVALVLSVGMSTYLFSKVVSFSLKTGKKKSRNMTDKLPATAARDFLQ